MGSLLYIWPDLTLFKGSLTEPLTDPPDGLSQPQGDLFRPKGSLNDLSGEDVRTYRFPLCSTGLCPPLGPKPCSHERLPQTNYQAGQGYRRPEHCGWLIA